MRDRRRTFWTGLGCGIALGLVAGAASGQDVAGAEKLFNVGRSLLEAGDYPAACAKFAESQRLDPSSGTLLNLATCHLKQGKTATAWAEFQLAARLARQQQRFDRAEEADARAAEVEQTLSYLTVEITAPHPGLEVRRDGTTLEEGSFSTRLPVDPGKHTVVATAPGRMPVTLDVEISAERDDKTLRVPALEPAPPEAPKGAEPSVPTPPGGPPGPGGGVPSAVPWVVGGVGLAAIGVGAAFGGLSLGSYGDADAACPTHAACNTDALGFRSDAELQANVANITIGVGIASVGVAAVLFIIGTGDEATAAPSQGRGPRSPRFSMGGGPGQSGLAFQAELP